MKIKLATVFLLVTLTGCSLIFGGPKSTVQKFLDAAKKGDVEGMNKLFSSKAVQNLGADKINDNNRRFAEVSQRSHQKGSYQMEDVQESIEGNEAFVSFLYKRSDGADSVGFRFDLSKDGSTWKINDIGPRDKQAFSGAPSTSPSTKPMLEAQPGAEGFSSMPSLSPTPETRVEFNPDIEPAPPPPPPPLPTKRPPISGGVLNGKATSLPKPAYPAVAKAAKASGTVVVQVTLDEEGNVISANAVSGHPLLRAAATAAARQAKFSPTKLSGQPVKVTGVITYNFIDE